jgi:uncharacterized Zn finger protein
VTNKCPKCGKFISAVTALVDGEKNIVEVVGDCMACGMVHPKDWDYEDFFPEPKSNEGDAGNEG